MFWLDDDTLLVGRGYRTNDAGIAAIRDALPDAHVHVFDLPHLHGRGEVLHLMSLISPLADDLVVAYLPLLPVRLVELLEARGIEIVEVPDDEFESMGANVLALAPRVALALARNVETRRRLERAGVEVLDVRGHGALEGRRRPDVPDAAASPRLTRARSSTASAGVAARGTPSTSSPGSRITTGRPKIRAKPISVSVP